MTLNDVAWLFVGFSAGVAFVGISVVVLIVGMWLTVHAGDRRGNLGTDSGDSDFLKLHKVNDV